MQNFTLDKIYKFNIFCVYLKIINIEPIPCFEQI